MAKSRINITIDPLLYNNAQNRGLNISAITDEAIKRKLGEKPPKEVTLIKCSQCGNASDKGYFCNESNRAWCIECHENLDISKICRGFHEKIDDQLLHFHHPFGNVPICNYGKTLKDIERGNANHKFNTQGSSNSNVEQVDFTSPSQPSLTPEISKEEEQRGSIKRILVDLVGIEPTEEEISDYIIQFNTNKLNIFSYAEVLKSKHGVRSYTHNG